MLSYNNGLPEEFGGWFTSFDVEYLKNGRWQKIDSIHITPEMNLDNSQWQKLAMMDYTITFTPITTKGIRIKGRAGGIPDNNPNNGKEARYYTAISELSVHKE